MSTSRAPRRLAEWVTFGISLALVLGLAAYLGWSMRQPVSDVVVARVIPLFDEVSERDGRFVLPIEVDNPGARTVRDLQVRVEYRGQGGQRESMQILIDYIGQTSEQVVYAYFHEDPRTLAVRAEPISYRVD